MQIKIMINLLTVFTIFNLCWDAKCYYDEIIPATPRVQYFPPTVLAYFKVYEI